MLIATVVFLPIVLAYTAWVYRVMRGRVTRPTLPTTRLPPTERGPNDVVFRLGPRRRLRLRFRILNAMWLELAVDQPDNAKAARR